jgi:chromosome condensin MukBEF MukE localization factor
MVLLQLEVVAIQLRRQHKPQQIQHRKLHQEQILGIQKVRKQANRSVMFVLLTIAIRLPVQTEAIFAIKTKAQEAMHLFAQKRLLRIVTNRKVVRNAPQRQVQKLVRNVLIRHQVVAIAMKAKAVAHAEAKVQAIIAQRKEVRQVVAAKAQTAAVQAKQEVVRQHQAVAKAVGHLLEELHQAEVVETNKKCYFCFSFL